MQDSQCDRTLRFVRDQVLYKILSRSEFFVCGVGMTLQLKCQTGISVNLMPVPPTPMLQASYSPWNYLKKNKFWCTNVHAIIFSFVPKLFFNYLKCLPVLRITEKVPQISENVLGCQHRNKLISRECRQMAGDCQSCTFWAFVHLNFSLLCKVQIFAHL